MLTETEMATHLEPEAALRALRDENVAIRRDKNELKRENEDLRKILEDFESRFTWCRNSRKRALQTENEKYRIQNEALTKDVESMRSEWEGFWRERENMVEKSKALSEALSEIELLNREKTDLENEKHTLQQTIKKMNLNSKREKEIMMRQCDILQNQVSQQDEGLQDLEVARLKTQVLTEENQSLRKKTMQLQLENHHMTRRFQYENELKRLQKMCVERDVEETQRNPQEQCDDGVGMPSDGEEENIALQEQAQVRTLIQKYEKLLDELGRENQSIHKRNGDLEQEVAEYKRTVCIEAMRHHFEGDQQEVKERSERSRDGEDASLQKDVACQIKLEEHQVVQQELQESLRQDYTRIQLQNQDLEQELQEAKDMILRFQSVEGNETLPEQSAQPQLRDLERVHNEVIQEKKTLQEQNEALEQRVQELIKELRDGEEVKRSEALAWPQEVQEFKSIPTDVKVFPGHSDTLVSESESLRRQNQDLDQEIQEAKNTVRIEKRLFAVEQFKAHEMVEASSDELQTLRILLTLKIKEIDELRSEVMMLKMPAPKE